MKYKNRPFLLKLTKDEKHLLEELSDKLNISMSEILRELLKNYGRIYCAKRNNEVNLTTFERFVFKGIIGSFTPDYIENNILAAFKPEYANEIKKLIKRNKNAGL